MKWFQLGYDNDHGECIFNLGSLYGQGKVNHYNGSCIEKAMELWQIAANKHNIVEAHFMIAQVDPFSLSISFSIFRFDVFHNVYLLSLDT